MTDHDDTLDEAARALRAVTEAPSPEAAATRARILASHAKRRSFLGGSPQWLAAAAVLVLFVGAPSAWALYTGRAARWIEAIVGPAEIEEPAPVGVPTSPRRGRARPASPAPLAPAAPEPSLEPAPIEPTPIEPPPADPAPVERDEAETLPSPALAPLAPAAPERAVGTSGEADDTSERDERLAYRRAHALQFEARDHGAAITAYDRYLARYPRGRFATEASYNRAVSLAHAGRRDEALSALAPFARGAHGGYRQDEAQELVRALEASEQP